MPSKEIERAAATEWADLGADARRDAMQRAYQHCLRQAVENAPPTPAKKGKKGDGGGGGGGGTSMLRVKGPGGAVWGVSLPPPRQAFVVPGAAQPDAADGDDAECAPPPLAAAWASAASGAASGAAASGGGGKGKKKKGRDASHLLGFTSERADAVGADED